jgi:hypothetical protein
MMEMYGTTVDRYMCSSVCPCPTGDHTAKFIEATGQTDDGLGFKINNRQARNGVDCNANINDLDRDRLVPMCFKSAGTSENFKDCWTTKLKAAFTLTKSAEEVQNIDSVIDVIGTIEEGLGDCSGACHKPLFGVLRKVTEGPVEEECVEVIVGTLSTLLGPAIVCILTFIVLLVACCGSCTLCRGFNKDDLETG